MPLQYVILAHTVGGATHFDLLLEELGQERLRTLQLERWPLKPGESCPCRELPRHRRVYLEYEGEISGGRGFVKRVDSGTWRLEGQEFVLASKQTGRHRLEMKEGAIFHR